MHGRKGRGAHRRSGGQAGVKAAASAPAQLSPPHRVSNLESDTRLEAWDDLVVETGGVERQRQLLREVTHFQFYFRADFLRREGQKKVRR